MTHNLIDVIAAMVTGYCKVHGTDSRECGAAREAGGLAILAVGIMAVAAHTKN